MEKKDRFAMYTISMGLFVFLFSLVQELVGFEDTIIILLSAILAFLLLDLFVE